MKHCRVPDCGQRLKPRQGGHGMCAKHYTRWRVHGDVNRVLSHRKKGSAEEVRAYYRQWSAKGNAAKTRQREEEGWWLYWLLRRILRWEGP